MMKMRAHLSFLAASLILVQILSSSCAASVLSADKYVEKTDIKTGDDVVILLRFNNPFGKEIPIKIVDKSVLGGSGVDIQCMEYALPNQPAVALSYDPIKVYSAGNYTLDAAQITYTNPETGKEESLQTNKLEVSVADSGTTQPATQSVTSIYRCGGMSMQSTSYSSTGQSQQQQQQTENQQTPESRVQNNQMNQDTNAVKQEIDEQKQMEDDYNKNLEKDPAFQKEQQNLMNQGYKPTSASQSLQSPDTGSFQRQYQKPTGENASIKGDMRNGTIGNMEVQSAEDTQKALEALRQDPGFQQMDKQLTSQGYNQTDPRVIRSGQNSSKINIPYNDSRGNQKNLSAEYANGTIKNLQINDAKKDDQQNMTALAVVSVILLFAAYLFSKKYLKKKAKTPEEAAPPREIDHLAEAKKMLSEAARLFSAGREKDAYEKVSQAVRYYYSHRIGTGRELTNTELWKTLEEKGIDRSSAQKCLNLCGLVEFAKYKANKQDFGEIMDAARGIIV